jgi:hypothetical protein
VVFPGGGGGAAAAATLSTPSAACMEQGRSEACMCVSVVDVAELTSTQRVSPTAYTILSPPRVRQCVVWFMVDESKDAPQNAYMPCVRAVAMKKPASKLVRGCGRPPEPGTSGLGTCAAMAAASKCVSTRCETHRTRSASWSRWDVSEFDPRAAYSIRAAAWEPNAEGVVVAGARGVALAFRLELTCKQLSRE